MKNIKSFLLITGLIIFSQSISAQFNIGPMLIYGTDTDLGFGLKADFNVADKINVSPSFGILSSVSIDIGGIKNKSTINEINVDGHYTLTDNGSTSFYGLAGPSVIFVKVKTDNVSVSTSKVGLNIGGGAKFSVSDSMGGFAQAKYAIGGAKQLAIHAGVYFSIGGK